MGSLSRQKPNAFIRKQKGFNAVRDVAEGEGINDALRQMVQQNQVPTRDGGLQGRITKPSITETDKVKIEIWNDMQDAEGYFFKARSTNKTTGEVDEYLAHSQNELFGLVAAEHGKFLDEQAETEAENNPKFNKADTYKVFHWLNTTVHGQECLSIWCDRVAEMMQAVIGNRPIDEVTLELAYCQIVDNPDYNKNFERYFQKRDRLIRESEAQTEEGRRLAEQEASSLARQQREEEQFSREQKIRFDEADIAYNKDLAKTPQGMKMLREKIQMEKKAGRTPTLPSSGTGQRI